MFTDSRWRRAAAGHGPEWRRRPRGRGRPACDPHVPWRLAARSGANPQWAGRGPAAVSSREAFALCGW